MFDEFMPKKKFFEEKFKVDIKVTPEIDLITIDPI